MPSDRRYGSNNGRKLLAGVALMAVVGCDAPQVTQGASDLPLTDGASEAEIAQQITAVTEALLALDASVDPDEAHRAAMLAVEAPLGWARDWRMTDPPLIHNFKVVNGLREKGVCQDFANAMHATLAAEGFRTLQIHRAIANARNLRLEHATVILTARGQPMEAGVVLDPWRLGQGRLWFGRVAEDDRFDWETAESARAWRLNGPQGG